MISRFFSSVELISAPAPAAATISVAMQHLYARAPQNSADCGPIGECELTCIWRSVLDAQCTQVDYSSPRYTTK
jgi:hypothetical protein